jgi:5-methylcytosine-specific restriction endonuclease McrA
MAIEDAEVDHKIPYSQGGSTTLDNAQLAHRYCNRHKGDRVGIAQ